MADRDPANFPGNPNPPAKAPDKAAAPAAPAKTPTSAGTGALPPESQSAPGTETPSAKGADSFSVTNDGIYSFSDTDVQKVGTVTLAKDDAEKLLKTSGATYDEERGTYDNVPEVTIKLLQEGPASLGADIKDRFNVGLAEFHRAGLGVALAKGELTAEDFRQRTQPDLVQMQLERDPGSAWKNLGDVLSDFVQARHEGKPGFDSLGKDLAHDAKLLPRMTITEAAKALPSLADLAGGAGKGAIAGGIVPALFGQPELIPVGMKLGAAAGSFLSLYNQELGQRIAGLADRGMHDDELAQHAPVEAVKAAVGAGVYMYGLDAMTAPFKGKLLSGLAESETAAKTMAGWAHTYAVNAGIKMPAVGVVHQAVSDLLDNMSALAENRPDLMKSPAQFSNNAIEAAAGMGRLGVIMGVPGAVYEGAESALDKAGEARLASKTDARLEGVERREPLAASPTESPSSAQGLSQPPSGEQSAGPSAQTASQEPLSGTPQAPAEKTAPQAADLKSPLPESITSHPGYVKAVEMAKEDLPPGVEPTDRQGVVNAFNGVAKESHDYINSVTKALGMSELGKGGLTPDEKNQIEAKIMEYAQKMRNLNGLAIWARDPEGAAAHADWEANGKEGPEPRGPIDPFNEARGYYKQGGPLANTETARFIESESAARAAQEKADTETLDKKDAEPKAVVGAAARLAEKTQEATVGARAEQVKSDLEALRQRIGEFASTRDRMQRNGLSTRAIDRTLNTLLDQAVGLQKEGEKLASRDPNELEVSPRAKLQMKPATLSDVMQAGFKEGGKQSQERARELLGIAEANGLTASDVRKLVGNRSIGAMGDVAYRNFLDGFERDNAEKPGEKVKTPGFKEGVEKLVERKKARAEVAQVLAEKQLEKEQYVRQLNNLPAFSKMTTEQLKDYADTLRSYDKGDEALSPKRIAALKGTVLEDAKTMGEVRGKVAELTGRPTEDFQNVRVPLKARAIPDPHLREWFPALKPFVDIAGQTSEKGERLAEVVRSRNEELAAEAIRERRATMGAGAKAADFFAPQQREVMAYLEAKDPSEVAARGEALTPAELKWANWLKAWFGTAEDYLVKKEGMQSRFSGSYAPHVNRGWPEVLRDLKDVGIAKSLKEFLPQAQGKNADFVDAQGNVLGFNKFFKQTIFRSGSLEPSRNVVEAANHYISDFYRKAALDQIAPVLDTMARAMKAPEETGFDPKQSEAMTSSLQDFVKAYANNKKGINSSGGAIGELLAPALRAAQTAAAIHYIAGNYALQAIKGAFAIPASEYMALGTDLFKAKALKYTDQGKAILEKYESFTGKSPWEEIGRPGADARDFARGALYGGFQMAHKTAMEDLLLGSMTKEEFATGSISDARLNEIRQQAGRWLDLHRSDSIMGSSEIGKTFTQYKSWAIPPTLSIAEDARALAKAVTGKGKMNEVQVRETMRLASLAAVAATVGTLYSKEDEDDSYRGQAIHYLRRALGSVWHGLDPAFFFSAAGPGYVAKLAGDLSMLVHLEEDKQGNLKGVKALKRDLTPRLVKDVTKAVSDQ